MHFSQPVAPSRAAGGASTFLLSCTPIVNLFTQIAEPIRVSHAETEYQIIPDVRRQNVTEVYAVDRVTCTASHLPEPLDIAPFYSFRHTSEDHAQPQVFWYATRRPSQRPGDEGTEVYLSLVDLTFQPNLPTTETLMVQVTCTNRDLPGKLPFGGDRGDFELEGQRPYCGSLSDQARRNHPSAPGRGSPVAVTVASCA